MKNRLLAVVLALILMIAPLTVPAYAYQPGEEIGQVLYTDIVAYIDNHAIRSYNINWNTYIVVEDLMAYGFGVSWLPEEGRLVIAEERTAAPQAYTAAYTPEANTHPAGSPAMPYLYTEITTWIGDTQVTGYNIGGYTCICMDDLAAHFAREYVWSPEDKALYMTSSALPAAPEQPDEQPPAEQTPSAGETQGLNEAEAAVDAFIRRDLELVESGEYTGEQAEIMAEFEMLYGEALVEELLAATKKINESMRYTITGSTVREDTASVYVTVTHKDLSGLMTETLAQIMAEITRAAIRGEELTEEEIFALTLRVMIQEMLRDDLPLVTTETVAYLDQIDGEWVVNEEESLDFINVLAGGMLSDPLFDGILGGEESDPII